MQEIINHIKQLITDKGLKQKYVAEQMGLSQNDFSNMMNGRKDFKVEYVAPLCKVLGISANELFRM